MLSIRRTAALLAGPALAAVVATSVVAGPSALHASGTFVNASGTAIGWVKLTEDRTGLVHVNVKVKGLTAGLHGIHIHAVGSCTTTVTMFDGAGGHYNPAPGHEHGLENPAGPHAGDLPNLVVDLEGDGTLNAKTDRVTISTASLFDADGSAFIIHANPDNQTNTPANGGSGGRVACAVVSPD